MICSIDEWNNLADNPDYASLADNLCEKLLAEFNPTAIETAIQASIPYRRILKQWSEITGVSWAYTPQFDATKRVLDQYLK